jgi:hypothetical protein
MLKTFQFLDATAALVALLLSQAQAQDDSELAKKTQNPVADLISVPLQSNFNSGELTGTRPALEQVCEGFANDGFAAGPGTLRRS